LDRKRKEHELSERFWVGVVLALLLVVVLPTGVSVGAVGFMGEPGVSVAQSSVDWWPMFHHDLNHLRYSTSKAPNTNNTIWRYTTCYEVDSSPAVADGKVYVGSWDGNVYALDASTGKPVWNYTTGGNVWSSPAVADGKVYVGSWDGNVYALDASTGKPVWYYTTGGNVWSSPAVADGKVYVGSWDGNVYAFGPPHLSQPPNIGVPSREPSGDIMQDQEVTVLVNVTDVENNINNVTLSYTTNNGTSWLNLQMNHNSTTGLYGATIPGQQAGTWVKYKITAFDTAKNQAVNDNAEKYYAYQVISKVPSAITPLIFTVSLIVVVTVSLIVVVIVAKRKLRKKPQN